MGGEVTVALVGPAGLVGREILELLEERKFPAGSIRLLGTHRTAGAEVEVAGRKERIALLTPQAFDGVELAFFAAGPSVAGEHAPRAAAAGTAVGGLSRRLRLGPGGPPGGAGGEGGELRGRRGRGRGARPGSAATPLGGVLGPPP